MKISRICSEFNKGYWNINLYGYDNAGNFISSVQSFKDYFYFKLSAVADLAKYSKITFEEVTPIPIYKSIFGDEAVRVYYSSIVERNSINEDCPDNTFEIDVQPEFKYILDNKLEWSDQRHILYFDIETDYDPDDQEANSPENAKMPITAIVCYSTKDKKYFVFSWHEKHTVDYDIPKIVEDENITYFFCKDETTVLTAFVQFVSMNEVDVLTGWYSAGFDLPYILQRCTELAVPYALLSPINNVRFYKDGEFWKIFIKGRDHIDMMDALKDIGYNLSNWKLSTAALEILENPNLEKITATTWRDWKDNYKGFLKYAIRDVEILQEIDKKLGIFPLYINIQQLSNVVSLSNVLHKALVVDGYLLSEYTEKIVFPTRSTKQRQDYMGAYVMEPSEPGLHKNVVTLDYTSLYPTVVMAFNISPETFIISEEKFKTEQENIVDDTLQPITEFKDLISNWIEQKRPIIDTGYNEELFGKRYVFFGHSKKIGILAEALRKLFIERRKIIADVKAGKYPKDEIQAATNKQMAFKLILNSAYGAMGFNWFRLYTPECADAITYFAREAAKYAIDVFDNQFGNKVLYCDTDSNHIEMGDDSIEFVKEKLEKFNQMLIDHFIPKYNLDPNPRKDYWMMDLKFEKELEFMYFSNAKKRYYGIEKGTGKKYIRGLNIIRKDTPKLLKKKLDVLVELAVRDQLTLEHLIQLRKEIETTDPKLIGITKAFSQPFHKYKVKAQHLTGAMFANSKLGTNITHRHNPFMFYIVSKCEDDLKPPKRQKAICLNEEDLHFITERPDIFVVDWNMFMDKQVIEPMREFEIIPTAKKVLDDYATYIKTNMA